MTPSDHDKLKLGSPVMAAQTVKELINALRDERQRFMDSEQKAAMRAVFERLEVKHPVPLNSDGAYHRRHAYMLLRESGLGLAPGAGWTAELLGFPPEWDHALTLIGYRSK